jgi:hypothetical protein
MSEEVDKFTELKRLVKFMIFPDYNVNNYEVTIVQPLNTTLLAKTTFARVFIDRIQYKIIFTLVC